VSNTAAQIHTLSADGAGLVIALSTSDGLPRVVHWGAAPGSVPPSPFGNSALPLVPVQHEGWAGRPAITGNPLPHRRFRLTAPPGLTESSLSVEAADADLSLAYELHLTPPGVIRVRARVRSEVPWTLAALRCLLPLPDEAAELLDFTGRWSLERVPQRRPFALGSHVRENRRGRTGHDSFLLVAGTPGFTDRHGEVWAVHVGWSGNHEHSAERMPDSTGALGGGELLDPGEIVLEPGGSYETPWVYFVWSGSGLDGLRDRFHRYLRSRAHHPSTPRPVVLNTWEAVYFQHDFGKLKALADTAASVGVERFVLDDGWFGARRDDRAGLGDWHVSEQVWPQGLRPLADHVHGLGMRFGLWFEPEMVNPDSDLYRAHPDWVLAAPGRLPAEFRQQHVLDLTRPEVFEYLLSRLDTLVTEIGVDFIKWDHNRDLVEAVRVHEQTLATYRLLATLRDRHAGLEIESCSSGGGRIDLGILEHTDRVWTSDTNDPVDRQQVQRWTGLLLPPELMGAHVGPEKTHITGRVTSLVMRCATALFGHAGLERDLTECSPQELGEIADWIALYKRTRGLLHSGRVVTPDRADPSASVHGVVAQDRRHALFCYAQLTSVASHTPLAPNPLRLRIPGLVPDTAYRVEIVLGPQGGGLVPAVIELNGLWRGRALATVGIPLPRLNPADALVLEFTAT
jgi:alpha-galactosidase